MHLDGKFGRLRGMAFLSRGFASALARAGALPQRSQEPGLCLSALSPPPEREFLRASKALRKPLTTSGWTRPELPSG
uniref:Secreted protein n=1 Tax=Heterorhabditis bacteriophora TaxID=37862 RepID=A0A1I7X170_HETBA